MAVNPERHTLLPLPAWGIIPGARFREIYYWDTLWVVRGLLVSGMHATAQALPLSFLQCNKSLTCLMEDLIAAHQAACKPNRGCHSVVFLAVRADHAYVACVIGARLSTSYQRFLHTPFRRAHGSILSGGTCAGRGAKPPGTASQVWLCAQWSAQLLHKSQAREYFWSFVMSGPQVLCRSMGLLFCRPFWHDLQCM